jgi:hypothetical protein
VLVGAATAVVIGQFVVGGAKVEQDGLAFVVVMAIACLWVVVSAIGAWLARTWSRGLIITWQLIQLAVGIGAMQGLLAGPLVGVVLLVLGLAGIVLVLTPGVSRALGRQPRAEESPDEPSRSR